MVFQVQQHLSDEMQPLLFELLALVEHLLHALHVGLSAAAQLVQNLLVLFFGLSQNRTFSRFSAGCYRRSGAMLAPLRVREHIWF